jgi:hypothetical protein
MEKVAATTTNDEGRPKAGALATRAKGTEVGAPLDRSAYANRGKSTNRDDKIVPMVKVLQSQSPQCLKQRPEYVKGAEAGDFYVRGALNPLVKGSEGLVVQPCAFLRCWLEFDGPRDSNPKFVQRHEDAAGRPAGQEDLRKDEEGFDFVSPQGHRFTFSREHYVLIGKAPYVIPFGGSAHSSSREWMTMMDQYMGEASWNRRYKITTVPRHNDFGDWYGFKIEPLPEEVTDEEFSRGAELWHAVEGGARAEVPSEDASVTSGVV